jgi:hypothetical protein
MCCNEVNAFLTHLADEEHVVASIAKPSFTCNFVLLSQNFAAWNRSGLKYTYCHAIKLFTNLVSN